MAFFNEFPHTRTYDSDLAWLIRRMKELLTRVDKIDELMEQLNRIIESLPETIQAEVLREFQRMIADGTFNDLIIRALNTSTPIFELENAVSKVTLIPSSGSSIEATLLQQHLKGRVSGNLLHITSGAFGYNTLFSNLSAAKDGVFIDKPSIGCAKAVIELSIDNINTALSNYNYALSLPSTDIAIGNSIASWSGISKSTLLRPSTNYGRGVSCSLIIKNNALMIGEFYNNTEFGGGTSTAYFVGDGSTNGILFHGFDFSIPVNPI